MDNDERQQPSAETDRMFGRVLWLKDNVPITPDEWGLLCALIFGDLPEKRPTHDELARARAHYSPVGRLTAVRVDAPAPAEHE
jgi:hypothetical protein